MQVKVPTELTLPEPTPVPPPLTEKQHRVYKALKEHSAEKCQFGNWYLGALKAIRDHGPDYLAQAANSIREIAEKLPEFAGVPQPESPISKTKAAVAAILKLRTEDLGASVFHSSGGMNMYSVRYSCSNVRRKRRIQCAP